MTIKFREDGITGEVETDGYGAGVAFSEWYNGEGYDFEVARGLGETQRFNLTTEEIYAIAKIGLLTHNFALDNLASDVDEAREYNLKRNETLAKIRENYKMPRELERDYDEAHRPITDMYTDELIGGDGTPEYYAVDGWGVIKLDNGDFEVSYKV